jgi:hypothetical protein
MTHGSTPNADDIKSTKINPNSFNATHDSSQSNEKYIKICKNENHHVAVFEQEVRGSRLQSYEKNLKYFSPILFYHIVAIVDTILNQGLTTTP